MILGRTSLMVKIIAEIGVNHAGSVKLAKQMIDAAKDIGADAVKFQTFSADRLVSQYTPKVQYQKSTTNQNESHYEMIKSLEFKFEDHFPVIDYCKQKNIEFISTPYDIQSAEFLVSAGVRVFKIASADIVDLSLNRYVAENASEAIISTGMATLGEIETVVDIYRKNNCNFSLLHCVSNYPCEYASLNLQAMNVLRHAFQCDVGYSDHAVGNIPAIISVALGAKIIEKHFTLDKNMEGPDHKASSDVAEFKELVDSIRTAELALGSPIKQIQEEEKEMRLVSRKSLFLSRVVKKGEALSAQDFELKRPGTGLVESRLIDVIGKKSTRELKSGEMLQFGDFSFE